MVKILYLITDLDVGGAERALVKLATHLDTTRFQPSVACLGEPGVLGEKLLGHSIPVTFFKARRKWDLGVIFRLRRLLDKGRYDILHTFLFHANIVGRIAALLAFNRPAVVASIRVAEPRRHHLWLEGWTSGLVDRFVAVSGGVRSLMLQRAGISPHKIVTIPNGVDPTEIPQGPIDIRAELKLPDSCPLVVTVGRLTKQKGLCFLIEAAGRILKAQPDAHFLIIGKGELERPLKRQAARRGVAANVHFLGWRPDAWGVVASADLFVLPSLWEGMPNALLEAMASGVPVVATQVAGSSEIIESGKLGVLVPPCHERILAQAILGLLSNPDRARQLGAAGQQHVLQNFAVERMVAAHEKLYLELMKQRQRARAKRLRRPSAVKPHNRGLLEVRDCS
jgi:starch synthase (maltosyl-transferring)